MKLELSQRVAERLTISVNILRQEKKGNKWVTIFELDKKINLSEYNLYLNTRIKGYRYYKGYTCVGYIVDKVTGISPSGDIRAVYKFDFKLN